MSGRRRTFDWSNLFLVAFLVLLGGVIIYEFFRRRRLNTILNDEQKKYDEDLKKANIYLDKRKETNILNDPKHILKED